MAYINCNFGKIEYPLRKLLTEYGAALRIQRWWRKLR